jgi:uncharacterized protein
MADLGRASAVPNVGMAFPPEKGPSANLQGARRLLGPTAMAQIESIYRYPVKGFSPERLPQVTLTKGATLPLDRAYAVENGPSKFDPQKPQYFPKIRFLELMRNARLAAMRTALDEETHVMTIRYENREAARGDLRTPEGRAAIERFLAEYVAEELRGPPRVLHAPGHSFSDVAKKVVSIINLASVAELENAMGAPVDPLRFRGNLHVSGWPAWHEFTLLGSQIIVGAKARLKVVKRIVRCAATEVDPQIAIRDLPIPRILMDTYDHADCGIYAEVVEGGAISPGDTIEATST